MTCGIYKIYNTIEDKCYIGQSLDIENRWKGHVNELKKGKHINEKLQLAFDKYGIEAFEFSILKEVEDLKWIDYYESYYTEKYNAVNGGYSIRELHSAQDIKFIIDNMDRLSSEWIKTLEFMNSKINKEVWDYITDLSRISDNLGITTEQTTIFLKYFEAEGFTFSSNFDTVIIKYMSQNYIDSKMENFSL